MHRDRAQLALLEIKEWSQIDKDIFDNFEKVKTADTFIYRFIKYQDMMGDKLFRIFLTGLGEYKDNMSLLDVLDKLEKLELIKSANEWMEFRHLRNQLTHEYPDNEHDIVEGIILALNVFDEMNHIFHAIVEYSQKIPKLNKI